MANDYLAIEGDVRKGLPSWANDQAGVQHSEAQIRGESSFRDQEVRDRTTFLKNWCSIKLRHALIGGAFVYICLMSDELFGFTGCQRGDGPEHGSVVQHSGRQGPLRRAECEAPTQSPPQYDSQGCI